MSQLKLSVFQSGSEKVSFAGGCCPCQQQSRNDGVANCNYEDAHNADAHSNSALDAQELSLSHHVQ